MPTRKISAAGDHLARMVGTKPTTGLAELVWNALDANATTVAITVATTDAGAVDFVTVTDDGDGFSADELEDMFDHVGGSWKHQVGNRMTKGDKRFLHGDKGEGRWKAFAIGDRVTWTSITAVDGKANQKVRLVMSRDRMQEYDWYGPDDTDDPTGTTVVVQAGMLEPNILLRPAARTELTSTLALYLTQYPDVTVNFDGDDLDVSTLIETQVELEVDYSNDQGPVLVTAVEWKNKVGAELYLCDEKGAALYPLKLGFRVPDVHLTAYVRWAGFRVHETLLALAEMGNDEVSPAINAARETLRQYYLDKRISDTKTVVQEWRDEEVYPYEADPGDALSQAEQALFNYVAVTASEAVNRIEDQQAKALSLRAIRVAVEHDPSSIEVIFAEVLKLPQEKIDEFRLLLERTSLSALVDAMRLVTDRLAFITSLELLLFDPDHAPAVLERAHLHNMIENEAWIFGEAFATHVSDKGLTRLLETHLNILGRDDFTSEPVTDTDGKARRIDFLFGRSLETNRNKREHLVVEIKRPTVTAGRSELDQIEDYANAVSGDSRFDIANVDWDFVLVVTDFDQVVERRVADPDRPRGLLLNGADGVRVWVRRWSEVIQDCRHRLNFIKEKLEYDPDGDEAVAFLRDRYPDYLPAHLAEQRDPSA